LDLVGDGWEWTQTPFAPFPGFEPMSHYPGYSRDFFDGGHLVLLGASWATHVGLVRRSFRNWFQPHYPYVFAKFRCVQAPV
jgi:formylglycine-generating enzyme required for sulfatase activity